MSELSDHFRKAIDAAEGDLRRITDQQSLQKREGGWSRREELGHLIDSCVNNHVRFTTAAIQGKYEGASYDADQWVELHGWSDINWPDLVALWRQHNQALERVVDRLPAERLTAQCVIGNGEAVTLEWLVRDYVDHLQHHVSQIGNGNATLAGL